jgi:hypothetical protein
MEFFGQTQSISQSLKRRDQGRYTYSKKKSTKFMFHWSKEFDFTTLVAYLMKV